MPYILCYRNIMGKVYASKTGGATNSYTSAKKFQDRDDAHHYKVTHDLALPFSVEYADGPEPRNARPVTYRRTRI